MKKRMVTKAETYSIYYFLTKQRVDEFISFDEFERDCLISVCEVNHNLRVVNLTEIFGCTNPECGCKIIQYPDIFIIRNNAVEFPQENEEQSCYFVSPDKDKGKVNSKPHLN